MTTPIMSPEAAEWIRDHVWPAWMRAMDDDYERGCFLLRMCACELGTCVACSQDGEHHHCLTRQHGGRPLGWDMAVWAWTSGRLPVHGRALADVMVAGRSCRWTCPCGCHHADPTDAGEDLAAASPPDRPRLEPADQTIPEPAPVQSALFPIGATP